MIPVIVVSIYLVIIGVIGSLAFRKSQANTEDFFLANRAVGSMVFFLSIFATNMTAFAILGSSGQAYRQGIGIYGLMASSSGFVIPLTIFFIGTRLWAIGKRFGHQTQVAFFRDRWECSAIGTGIFTLSVTGNVFFGARRETVWVNIFQTLLFLLFGAVAGAVISHSLPDSFGDFIQKIATNPKTRSEERRVGKE